MKHLTQLCATAFACMAFAQPVSAFCGFYVTKADTQLFNKASQVVLVRDGDRTVMTMANDFRGDPREFAMVIPVPTTLERDQIHVGDKQLIDHLDAYSAPRLVEYFDGNPCSVVLRESLDAMSPQAAQRSERNDVRNRALGVSVEASYTVGEYDILILSARQSDGLETWLTENGYRIPAGASAVLGSYIRQNMRFFVARVNLEEQSALGFAYLRPLQIAYESPKFMLPIRLGMVNADGPQDLFVYALTRKGRVETTNYRTVKLPSNLEVPLFLKDSGEFGSFYQAMFDRRVEQENRRGVFLEYAWDMSWCDPCAADPPTTEELRQLGVFWVGLNNAGGPGPTGRNGRVHHPPARSVRRRALPGRPALSGDRRPVQLSRSLRFETPVDGDRELRCRRAVSRRAHSAVRAAGSDAGVIDRLGHPNHPSKDGDDRCLPGTGWPIVVAADLE